MFSFFFNSFRVIVTAVLANRMPPKLHLFRNYIPLSFFPEDETDCVITRSYGKLHNHTYTFKDMSEGLNVKFNFFVCVFLYTLIHGQVLRMFAFQPWDPGFWALPWLICQGGDLFTISTWGDDLSVWHCWEVPESHTTG